MMILTFDEAVAHHKEMWTTIAEMSLEKGANFRKKDYFRMKAEREGCSCDNVKNDCYGCAYTNYVRHLVQKYLPNRFLINCDLCPIVWGKSDENEFIGCMEHGSPYLAYVTSRISYRLQRMVESSMAIANAPIREKFPIDDLVTAVTEYKRKHEIEDRQMTIDQIIDHHQKKWNWIILEMMKTKKALSEIEYYTQFPEEFFYSTCGYITRLDRYIAGVGLFRQCTLCPLHKSCTSNVLYYEVYEDLRNSPNETTVMSKLVKIAESIFDAPIDEIMYRILKRKEGVC